MKQPPAPRTHTPDEPPPVMIHHPEEDATLLAKGIARAAAKGSQFWLTAAGIVAAAGILGYFVSGFFSGNSASSQAWSDVLLATSPTELRQIAASNESTPAGAWALLGAANESYGDALKKLPADRDAALPLLTVAFDTYKDVADTATNDDVLRRMGVLGMARSKEARGELADAIVQYERIAKEWPGTNDAKRAEARVKALNTPEVKEFYSQFTAFKPRTGSGILPPRGSGRFDFGSPPFGIPSNHPPMDGPVIPAPGLGADAKTPAEAPAIELPKDPFATPKDEASKPK